jgi:uncharacterized SAM-binding protein YcdF (DUF218 family)
VARRQSSRLLKLLLVLAALGIAAIATRNWWLSGFGYALIRDDAPVKSDIAVVLAGDFWGNRIKKGGDLVRQGYVPAALISGPTGAYGHHECDLAIDFAVHEGYPTSFFIPFPDDARSTQEEAWDILPELRRRNVHRTLLVTSDYHSARAYRTFAKVARQMGFPIEIRVIDAPDVEFHADSWWKSRQGQKITFMEWSKTVAAAIGL